jgi:hypothetical protein
MNYELSVLDRIDSLYKTMTEKTIQYKYNKANGRHGMAEIIAGEILELKSILHSNQSIAFNFFQIIPDQGFYTN